MKTKAKRPEPKARAAPGGTEDVRGNVRVYADIHKGAATELAVMAARRNLTKKALLELLIYQAMQAK
jgi:hypothetical protein